MTLSRRRFLTQSAAAAAGLALWQAGSRETAAAANTNPGGGPFAPSWESLGRYQCPDWFRDAKFGIWAHWTAQCVPEQGDWYARAMYEEGSHDYQYQVAHYGHPSKSGFKDMNHRWKAEHWDPEHLMGLYKAAGAKYFVALAQHHDNFDCFDSKHQPWNSVALGPKKDIVGTWAKAARRAGLRFGVTSHGSHAWSWYEVAQGADKKGPLAGVPYDGHLTKADGKGLWWEGLDPQDLYAQNHAPGKGGLVWDWDAAGGSSVPDAAYCEKFYNRTVDLLDKYHPDLLYFDDSVLPLYKVSDVGLRIAAYHYNSSLKRHGGRLEAVLNGKGLNEAQQRAMVHDFERGRSDRVVPHPWQTDTCIGNWHYDRAVYNRHGYKTPDQVVKMLVDIVSKNGNLLLNIPVRGDGTIDDQEMAFLEGMAAWMTVGGEAIFGTRPWTLSGEGPVKVRGGGFSEGGEERLTAQDIRFTTRGDVLYATALGWPEVGDKLVVQTLARNAPGIVGTVRSVRLLGCAETLSWSRTAAGLEVSLPRVRPGDHAYVLKIEGLDLAASRPAPPPPPAVRAGPDGRLSLLPDTADAHGLVHAQGGATPNLGFWDNPQDTVSWRVRFDVPGDYAVSMKVSASYADTALTLDAGPGASAMLPAPKTAGWDDYRTVDGGTLTIPAAGERVVTARPDDPAHWHALNLASVTLTRRQK